MEPQWVRFTEFLGIFYTSYLTTVSNCRRADGVSILRKFYFGSSRLVIVITDMPRMQLSKRDARLILFRSDLRACVCTINGKASFGVSACDQRRERILQEKKVLDHPPGLHEPAQSSEKAAANSQYHKIHSVKNAPSGRDCERNQAGSHAERQSLLGDLVSDCVNECCLKVHGSQDLSNSSKAQNDMQNKALPSRMEYPSMICAGRDNSVTHRLKTSMSNRINWNKDTSVVARYGFAQISSLCKPILSHYLFRFCGDSAVVDGCDCETAVLHFNF